MSCQSPSSQQHVWHEGGTHGRAGASAHSIAFVEWPLFLGSGLTSGPDGGGARGAVEAGLAQRVDVAILMHLPYEREPECERWRWTRDG